MRATAILNLKGGVGKTTTAIHLAVMLSQHHNARVLLVDCDHQCNLSQFFGIAKPEGGSTAKVLTNPSEFYAISSIQETQFSGVDILPAEDSLMELDLSQLNSATVYPYIFRQLVLELGRREKYDYVLFDCPPAFSSACAASLIAADDVIIPIKLDAFSVQGMGNVMRQVKNMQRINSRLRVAGILPTMWYPSAAMKEAEQLIRKCKLHIYPHIRRSVKADESTFSGDLAGGTAGHIRDYKLFVGEYVGGGA